MSLFDAVELKHKKKWEKSFGKNMSFTTHRHGKAAAKK